MTETTGFQRCRQAETSNGRTSCISCHSCTQICVAGHQLAHEMGIYSLPKGKRPQPHGRGRSIALLFYIPKLRYEVQFSPCCGCLKAHSRMSLISAAIAFKPTSISRRRFSLGVHIPAAYLRISDGLIPRRLATSETFRYE